MKAYFIFDVREVIDSEKLDRYTHAVLDTVRAHGGRYLEVGGRCEAVEGDWSPNFLVLIEFPGSAAARAWYESAQYRELKTLRLEGSSCDGVIVEAQESDLRKRLVGEG
jgi:uncharacterized protein (DUF1330 family)